MDHSKLQGCLALSKTALILIASLALFACDPNDELPVKKVDSQQRLSDAELQLQQFERAKNNAKNKSPIFYFGFDLRGSPQEDAAQYLPFLNYLESATGYQFKLHFTPKHSTTIDELGTNKSQFAAMGASGFLQAQLKYGAKSLVRGLNLQGEATYQSVFVVRPDSDISSIKGIKGIKGRSLAFGSIDSTQGHLIPRIILSKNAITLDDLTAYAYTGSHQNCAEAVVSSKFDVCGMQDKLAKNLASQGLVKILHSSRDYPSSGIAVNKSVPDQVADKVRQALVNFDPVGKHSRGLHNWESTEMAKGFIAADERDYDDLRHWSIKFGFLQGADTTAAQP